MRHQNSVFHTVLKHVPWHVFDRLVDAHGADARVRRLSTRDQFIALLYGQLAGAQSLREIEFVSRSANLVHSTRSNPSCRRARRPFAHCGRSGASRRSRVTSRRAEPEEA